MESAITRRFSFLFIVILQFDGALQQTLFNTVRVPGFFASEHNDAEKAFIWTFQKLNLKSGRDVLLAPVPYLQDLSDSFQLSRKACQEIGAGAKVIFGPSSTMSIAHIQTISSTLGIPHIQFNADPNDVSMTYSSPTSPHIKNFMSINLYPSYRKINEAQRDFISHFNWNSFTIVYDDFDGLIRLQDVILESVHDQVDITIRQLDENPENYGKMFKAMKESAENQVIVDCDVSKVDVILEKALEVEFLDVYTHLHFTTLDMALVDLDTYMHIGANITSFSIISKDNPVVQRILSEWKYELFKSKVNLSPVSKDTDFITTEVAMVYDAVHVFDRALANVRKAITVNFDEKLSCNATDSWDDGASLINYMKTIEFEGMTGRVQFGKHGLREDFMMDILRLSSHGLEKIGTWDSTKPAEDTWKAMEQDGKTHPSKKPTGDTRSFNITKRINITKALEEQLVILENQTLRVVTKTDDPYVFARERNPDGTIKYTGFVIDILDEISRRLKFKYNITKSTKEYGGCSGPGNCTGMMKELVQHDADLAVAGMTITAERDEYVDFTKPFLNLGITILIKKPIPKVPNLFGFLDPFDPNVWMFMVAGFICVSIILFIAARFSPYEWVPPENSTEDSEEIANQFSLLNSVWFTIGCFLQQGSDLSPLATSTRTIAVVWWFFTMILISSYTANLAAFLTVNALDSPIESIDDLSKQNEIKYGTLQKGSTHDFFKFSRHLSSTYGRVWNFMKSSPGVLVSSSKEGIQKVLDEDYAFFAESTSVEYHVARKCKLMQVGGELNNVGYGFALPMGSPFLKNISMAIIQLNEEQVIETLYLHYWKNIDGGNKCSEKKKEVDPALRMENVAGVFVVLISGCVAALIFSVLEFLWMAKKNAKKDEQSHCSEITEEIKYILPCLQTRSVEEDSESEEIPENSLLTPL